MHPRVCYCMLLVWVLGMGASTSVQGRVRKPRDLLAPYNGSPGLQLPLPGGGSATVHDAYVQAASCNKITPPPSTSIPATQSPSPLTLTDTLMGVFGTRHQRSKAIGATGHTSTVTQSADVPLPYLGGRVMSNGANVYMIYVGYKPTDATPLWLNHLVANLGYTRWWSIMQRYSTKKTKTFSTELTLAGVTYIPHVRNNSDPNTAAPSIVQQAIDQKLVASDVSKGIYVVVSAPNKGLPTCDDFDCGWHDALKSGYRFAYMPGECDGCSLSDISNGNKMSPSGSTNLDGVADTLVHELAETVTDPFGDAWMGLGGENGDLCQLDYGNPDKHTFPGGHTITYNQVVGGYPYLFQRLWDPTPVKKNTQKGCVYGV